MPTIHCVHVGMLNVSACSLLCIQYAYIYFLSCLRAFIHRAPVLFCKLRHVPVTKTTSHLQSHDAIKGMWHCSPTHASKPVDAWNIAFVNACDVYTEI